MEYPDSIIRFSTGHYTAAQRLEARKALEKRQAERVKNALGRLGPRKISDK